MGAFIDETGNKYNKLLVISRAETPKGKTGAWWLCRCDCGKETVVLGTLLRNGNTKSCGCLQKDFAKSTVKDETGNVYGFLTVMERTESKTGRKTAYWRCVCQCGEETVVEGTKLRSGHTRSCGKCRCFSNVNKIDEVGNKYGKLLVLEEYGSTTDGKVLWRCLCECGNEKITTGKSLRNGLCLSCGCLHSLGEEKVQKILTEIKIKFERQKTFEDCRNPKTNYKLYFDFFLPDFNIVIEYQGEQHYREISRGYFSESELQKLRERDNIKKEYCLKNKIKFVEIPYYDFDKLDKDYLLEVIL